MANKETIKQLDEMFDKLNKAESKSLLKKYLNKKVYDQIKKKKTKMGATLVDVIQSGIGNLDSGIGIYAPDAEAYTLFSPLFYPVIADYHIGFDLQKGANHPAADFGLDKVAKFEDLDPENKYIISTRIRCGRSLEGYPFNPLLTEAQYLEMEKKVSETLKGLAGDHAGTYYPLVGMEADVQKKLIDDHFLFKEGDRFLEAAKSNRFWPKGRGIFHNEKKTFLVWVNEEDHLRIISMQQGGNVAEVYQRLIQGVQEIEKRNKFSRDKRLGYLTFCPTNLGTTIRASVHIKLPKIAGNEAKFKEVAAKYNLQVRGTSGEHTESVGGVYDVSNKRRMGLTEFQAVEEMYNGVKELIKLEAEAQ